MLEYDCSPLEKWSGVNSLIHTWLDERQELIKLYCAMSVQQELDTPHTPEKVKAFCQLLLDYLSAGHFEVYGQLMEEARHLGGHGPKIAKIIYPLLSRSTEVALDFNEAYISDECCVDKKDTLKTNLSYLGETLSDRFFLEDTLIEQVHDVHRQQMQMH
jgi:regulator of sigma D